MKKDLFKISLALSMLLPFLGTGQTITLGSASTFVLFTSVGAVTNSGTGYLTHLTGNVGSNSGSSTGFGNVDGGMHDGDVISSAASSDLGVAYGQLNTATATSTHSSSLGAGETLSPGVFAIATAATLNTTLTLDAGGDAGAVFIFQIDGALSIGSNAKVKLINGALACNVYWKTEGLVSVGSSATIRGTIVAHNAAISFGALDSLEGRALSINGAISLNSLTAFTPIGCGSPVLTGPTAPVLGDVGSFALFSSIGPVSNGGAVSYVTGDIGTNLGLTTGYDPLYVVGTIHPIPDGATALAATALAVAYGQLNALSNDIILLYPALFGHNLVLTPHTYLLGAATSFTDTVFLNAQGNRNAVFVIKVNGALSTISGAVVKLINGTQAKNVYWMVEGAVNLANNTTFYGTIVANNGAIDITSGAKFFGRALTTNGALTTSGDSINAAFLPEALIIGDSIVCVAASIPMTSDDTGGVWSLTNSFATISASGILTGVSAGVDTVNYTITNPFGTVVGTKVVTIKPLPNSGVISGPTAVCIGSSITLTNPSIGGVWASSNSHASVVNGIVTGASAGLDTISYTVSNSCGDSVATHIVTIHPDPVVTTVLDQIVCNGLSTTVVTFSSTVVGTTYTWTNSNTSVGLAASGLGNIPAFTALNTTSTATVANIVVSPSANACTGASKSFSITVNPTPNIDSIPSQVVCNNAATALVVFTGTVSASSFSWTNDMPSIGLASSGVGNIPSFTATNTADTVVIAHIVVSPSTATCSGPTRSFTIRVNPTPTVAPGIDQTICNGATSAAINFSGTVAGTNYNWTNDNTSIGLASSGLGNISPFTALNSGTTPSIANISVSPSANSCTGVTNSFVVRVNPTPSVDAIANQVVCNNAATALVVFTSAVSGSTFSWTNDMPSIGLASSGVGTVPSFTATNNSDTVVIAHIVVLPSSATCAGPTNSFTIRVNPTPSMAPNIDQAICNGAATVAINFTGTVAGTMYTWTNDNPTIGLASSGLGNISSFTAINNAIAPSVANISVTPSANSCNGLPNHFVIRVNPTPNVNDVPDQVICNGALSAPIAFIGLVDSSVFNWVNDNASIGLASFGTGNINPFTATNTSSSPSVANITVAPIARTCIGPAKSFSIVVNPTPNVALVADQTICNGSATSLVSFTGSVSATVFSWTNSNNSIGLAASGLGNIASFAAINNSSVPVFATITVTPSANGCTGTPINFIITVNPTPTVLPITNQSVCSGLSTKAVSFSSLVSGTSFSWTNSSPSIGLAASGTGNIPSFTAINNTGAPIVATITVLPEANACVGTELIFTITVNANPIAPIMNLVTDPNVCDLTYFRNFGASTLPPAGTNYTWTTENAQISKTGSTQQYALVNFKSVGLAKVILTVTQSGTGCLNATYYEVNVSNNVADVPAMVTYFNKSFVCLQNNEEAYAWGYDNASTLEPTFLTTEMNQDYVNATPDFEANNYWVMVSHNACHQKTYFNRPDGSLMKLAHTDISIFPNPADQKIAVGINTNVSGNIQMEIYSMMGQKMYETDDAATHASIDISSFASGVYMVVYHRNNERIASSRFIKK